MTTNVAMATKLIAAHALNRPGLIGGSNS
jgi:hypothetical protein